MRARSSASTMTLTVWAMPSSIAGPFHLCESYVCVSELASLRRRAILAETALETITRLTDEVAGMFDRLIGKLFRRQSAGLLRISRPMLAPSMKRCGCWPS